jgi:hypothetical protein
MDERFFLDNLWRWKCGLSEDEKTNKIPDIEELKETEWDLKFETLMRNRLIMGRFRYGPFSKQNRTTDQVIKSIIDRSNKYIETGNDELLVDIANLAMKEFSVGRHPLKHFKAVDDGKHA